MNEMTETMLKTCIDSFDSFPCENEQVNAEIEAFKQELTEFAHSVDDVAVFMKDYEAKGYGKRYLDLFGKIAQAQASNLTVEDIEERQQITPVEFAAQYNSAYEAVKASGYRVKAEQAYKNIFNLAERSEDMLDFNIACERGNLLFKLSDDDAGEQSEFVMEASDPLDKIGYSQHERRVKNWQQAVSDADITFSSDIEQETVTRNANRETQRMTLITAVTALVTEYVVSKNELLAATKNRNVRKSLNELMNKREEIKYLINDMLPSFGLNLETLFGDKYYRRLLLLPANLDATGRIKSCHHPQNIEAVKEIITEEILTDKAITELVFRPADTPFYFPITQRNKEVIRKYEKEAEEMNSGLRYYMSMLSQT